MTSIPRRGRARRRRLTPPGSGRSPRASCHRRSPPSARTSARAAAARSRGARIPRDSSLRFVKAKCHDPYVPRHYWCASRRASRSLASTRRRVTVGRTTRAEKVDRDRCASRACAIASRARRPASSVARRVASTDATDATGTWRAAVAAVAVLVVPNACSSRQ